MPDHLPSVVVAPEAVALDALALQVAGRKVGEDLMEAPLAKGLDPLMASWVVELIQEVVHHG
jgi:hypothetical protein